MDLTLTVGRLLGTFLAAAIALAGCAVADPPATAPGHAAATAHQAAATALPPRQRAEADAAV